MGIRFKFNLVLLIVFVLGLAVSGYISYYLLHNNARLVVLQNAGVMMEAVLSMRHYTVSEVSDKLAANNSEFLPQSVPAYAATEMMNQLRKTYPDYAYKEATVNPTNPRNRAVDWETDIINEFRNNDRRQEISGTRLTPTGMSLYLARPLQIKEAACLACHTTPDVAPASMVKRYGPSNGFGWKLNEIVGAQIVSVPMSLPVENANRALLTFTGSLAAVFVALFIILNLMLSRLIVRPITRMSAAADQISTGSTGIPELSESGNDEVAMLAKSFNRMRRSLEKAMQMIES